MATADWPWDLLGCTGGKENLKRERLAFTDGFSGEAKGEAEADASEEASCKLSSCSLMTPLPRWCSGEDDPSLADEAPDTIEAGLPAVPSSASGEETADTLGDI